MMSKRNPFTKALAPEGHVVLEHGEVFYAMSGPVDGRPLLLIHGATVPHWEFAYLVPHLHRRGYRTLCFDLYGHGRSAMPRVRYTVNLFAEQAEQVLDRLGYPLRFGMVGHSMGAAVAASLSTRMPGRVSKLVLVAPMLNFSASQPYARMLRAPLLGSAFMRWVGVPALIRRRRLRYLAIGRPELAQSFEWQAMQKGFWRTVVSLERDGALGDQSHSYRALAEQAIQTLLIWGSQDRTVPRADVLRIHALLHHSELRELPDLEHNLMLAAPAQVAEAIAGHLSESSGPEGM